MLICVKSFRMELRAPSPTAQKPGAGPSEKQNLNTSEKTAGASDVHLLKNLDVVLVIDELRVISFDRYGMKLPSSVAFDDQVRSNLSYLRHFLMKQVLLLQSDEFEMAPISSMQLRQCNAANEERSSYFPQGSIAGQGRSSLNLNGNVNRAFGQGKNFSPAKNQRKDQLNDNQGSVVQMRDQHSGGLKQNRLAKQLNK